jgi:hypothetical protein
MRSLWRFGSQGENQLQRVPVPTRDHPTGDLALPPVHTELSRLAERGIMVSYETVRRWVYHFGPMIAADLRKRRPTVLIVRERNTARGQGRGWLGVSRHGSGGRGLDLPRKSGEVFAQPDASFSNWVGLRKSSAECRRTGL